MKWICHLGIKYGIQEYVIIDYQEDDLPLFGKIEDIAVIDEKALLCVSMYRTLGFHHHFHCYVIGLEYKHLLSELEDYQPLRGHSHRNVNDD